MKTLITATSLLLLATLGSAASAHPYHVSLAEAEINRETGLLEVALRVDSTQLEQWLRRQGEGLDLDDAKSVQVEQQLRRLLSESFRVVDAQRRPGEPRPLPLRWIGREVGVKHVWLFFEFPLDTKTDDAAALQLENRLFFQTHPEQVNTINVRIGRRVKSLRCTVDRPSGVVER